MNRQKHTLLPKSLLAVPLISLSLVSLTQLPIQAEVASAKKTNNIFNITFEPPNENQPQSTRGGASRGSQCAIDSQNISQPFAPILPSSNIGLTTASHPTLLAYVPETSAETVFLTLQDENGEEVYQTVLPLGSQSGVVSLDIPQESPALEMQTTYKWSFALMCNNKLRPDSPVISGYIKRVQPETELIAQLEGATPEEMAAIYGKSGIWYETVAILAQLREAEPQNRELINAWNSILNSVGLEKFAQAEFTN